MSMTSVRYKQTVERLSNKEHRDAFVSSWIDMLLAKQIRATREDRGWTQAELGERSGNAQETISSFERTNYGKYTLRSLKRLASAFDVALIVRLVPFSDLVRWTANLAPESLAPKSFEEEFRNGIANVSSSVAIGAISTQRIVDGYTYEEAIMSTPALSGQSIDRNIVIEQRSTSTGQQWSGRAA